MRGEHIREWDGRLEQNVADFELVMPLNLDEGDKLELMLRAVPASWLREAYKQGRRPEEMTRDEALDMFERLETAETITEGAVSGNTAFQAERPQRIPRSTIMGPRYGRDRKIGRDSWTRQQNSKQGYYRAANRTPARITTGQASQSAVRDTARQFPRQKYARAGQPSFDGNRNRFYGARQYGSLEESSRDAVQPGQWPKRPPRRYYRNNVWRMNNNAEAQQRQQRQEDAKNKREANVIQKADNESDSDVGF